MQPSLQIHKNSLTHTTIALQDCTVFCAMRRAGLHHGGAPAPTTTVARAGRVLRAAVAMFFHGYHCYTSVAGLLVLPFSAAVLASGAMASSTSSEALRAVSARIRGMFHAAGFPPSSFFALLNAKLSQTVFTFAAALPFTLTFLLLAKACVAAMLRPDADEGAQEARGGMVRRRAAARARLPPCASVAGAYPAVVATHLFGSFVMLSANAAVFSLLFLAFNGADLLGLTSHAATLALSAAGAIAYSVAVGIATVVCNLAVVVAAMERRAGHAAVLRACVVIKGRVPTALALALPTNLGMAAAEALFQLRVVSRSQSQHRGGGAGWKLAPGVAGEAFSIAYIHALCVVLEIIVSCMFYRSCRRSKADELRELEPEEKGDLQA
ncbi:hypothetical protein E2562_002374 [Oryza meyeriana var. granulata]|uniref:Uncharacterized protein n=1 Tax=Oryza meyeriana var. granulata TaxID=110450 RepID=A0A6G1BID0_9ORYZ|nr:hypothetical protein E2562_002374 [Oryza meyeriana var. granulata]